MSGRDCTWPDWVNQYQDTSWGNDVCPSRLLYGEIGAGVRHARLWIDYDKPADREEPKNPKFLICEYSDSDEVTRESLTDDCEEARGWCEEIAETPLSEATS